MNQAPEKYPGDSEDWESDPSDTVESLKKHLREINLWKAILEAAENNPALQEALDRVKIIYHLSKNNGQK